MEFERKLESKKEISLRLFSNGKRRNGNAQNGRIYNGRDHYRVETESRGYR